MKRSSNTHTPSASLPRKATLVSGPKAAVSIFGDWKLGIWIWTLWPFTGVNLYVPGTHPHVGVEVSRWKAERAASAAADAHGLTIVNDRPSSALVFGYISGVAGSSNPALAQALKDLGWTS